MRLHHLEWGEGPPCALLHGLFGEARNFTTIARRLAGRGFRAIALDLRNHGESPRGPATYPAMAEDVAETLTTLGARPAHLIGHSMGGKVAMHLALTDPAALLRLVVADIAPVAYPPREHRALLAALTTLPLRPGLSRREADAALAPAIPDPKLRAFLLHSLVLEGTPRFRFAIPELARDMPALEDFPLPAGAHFPGPTLFILGARSPYVRPEHRPLIASLFPAARFVTLPEAGHWVHADDPEGFLAAVTDFLTAEG